MKGEGEILELGGEVHMFSLHHYLFVHSAIVVVTVVASLKDTSYHGLLDGLLLKFILFEGADDLSVPENRKAAAALHDLLQVMGDEDHCLSFLGHAFHDGVDDVSSLLG